MVQGHELGRNGNVANIRGRSYKHFEETREVSDFQKNKNKKKLEKIRNREDHRLKTRK